MPLTLKTVERGSGSAGTEALTTAGELFDKAIKGFTGAAETVQGDIKRKYDEGADANTRQLLSELRDVAPEDVPGVQSTALDSATRRFGKQFDPTKLDTAIAGLEETSRAEAESDYQYGQTQLQRGLSADPAGAGIENLRASVTGIEEQLRAVDPSKRGEIRNRLQKEAGVDAATYLDELYASLKEGQRSGEDVVNAVAGDPLARRLGVDTKKIAAWTDSRKEATGQKSKETAEAQRAMLQYRSQLGLTEKKLEPVAMKERLDYLDSQGARFLGERWNDIGTKDRETVRNLAKGWIDSGLSDDQILNIYSEFGRGSGGLFWIGGGPDVEAMEEAATKMMQDNLKAQAEAALLNR